MANPDMQGIYNAVSPGIVSNQHFSERLATKLGKSLLGQRVKPTRTQESGYAFKFPRLDACLDDLLAGNLERPQI